MRTLRQILKLCRPGHKLTVTDSITVRDNVLASTKFTDRQKEIASDVATWFVVRNVCWARRKLKCLHMCYTGCVSGLPLTLAGLEARTSTRAPRARKSTDSRDLVLAACRDIIRPQIEQYRTKFWQSYELRVKTAVDMGMIPPRYPLCPLTGKCLKTCATHVDHTVTPFVRIAEAWAEATGQSFEVLASTIRKSRALGRYTFGSTLADQSWAEYHKSNAVLQLVEAKANMSKGAK